MSDSTGIPAYDDLADTFWRLGVMQSPSQLHGWLAGQLAIGAQHSSEQWLQQAHAFLDPVGAISEADGTLLLDLLSTTRSQMSSQELSFTLLLPDDMVDIRQRVESLAHWCHGFLAGFAVAGKERQKKSGQQNYSTELSETLSDMAAISQVGLEGEEADVERSEQDYFQIIEYLRVATVNTYLECNPIAVSLPTISEQAQSMSSPDTLFNSKTLH